MKQQRPFVVEIKQKRGLVKRPQSIWAGINLAAIANDIAEEKPEGPFAGAAPQPIFLAEDFSSQPMAAIGDEEIPSAGPVVMPNASVPEPPTAEEAPVPEAWNAPTGERWTPRKKRWQKDMPLPRGERWKRRLKWLLRQSRTER